MPQTPLLTTDNYAQGFLLDEELMGGISPHPEVPGVFVAYVVRHTTGETLGHQPFASLDEALDAINRVERAWAFERSSGCGSGNCGGGNCKGGGCRVKREAGTGAACATGSC